MIELLNIDCMEYMKTLKDNAFDLAIVDPPYGIGQSKTIGIGVGFKKGFTHKKEYKEKEWDRETPTKEYFNELYRVSKNQIIWGANYFIKEIKTLKNYLYWHKKGMSRDCLFNEGEMAYVSIGRTRMVDIWWNGVGVVNSGEKKIHPTQKPVKLYDWLLKNYAKEGDKILDTHLGSGSSAIAAHYGGFDFVGCELDKDYFKAAQARFNDATRQKAMF